jgi:uncharacterized protein (TIGR02996 family)
MLAIEGGRAAFLRAVCAAPADDTPRLVFADWLDEYGEGGRAEFVRAQCESVRLLASGYPCFHDLTMPDHCDVCRLRRRGRELLRGGVEYVPGKAYRHVWFPIDLGCGFSVRMNSDDTIGLITGDGLRVLATFRRGFIEQVACSGDEWVRVADAIHWHPDQSRPCPATAHPITTVRLTPERTYIGRGAEGEPLFCGRLIAWTGRGEFTCEAWPGVAFALVPF